MTLALISVRYKFFNVYIGVCLPEGIYTVEVTLPDEEPQYYHIIVSDKNNCTYHRFEM